MSSADGAQRVGAAKPTIIDVARHAGVSKGLVSLAFNGRPGVSAETRSRILDSADELGWRPSLKARSLSTRTAFALGLVIRRESQIIAADPFFPAFIAGIESVLGGEGRVLVLSMVPDEDTERQTYTTLAADNRVDGVFVTDLRRADQRIALLQQLGLPAVTIGRPDALAPYPAVTLDDTAGIRQAVQHLVALGHRRIAHVAGDPRMLHGLRRAEAFSQAAQAADLESADVIETNFSAASGAAATRSLLESARPPTAIVYANDPMAIAGLGVLHQRGLQVPADMSIIGFDGSEASRHIHPPLTSVEADAAGWGAAAARTLLDLITNGQAAEIDLAPAALVLAASTAPPPAAPARTSSPAAFTPFASLAPRPHPGS